MPDGLMGSSASFIWNDQRSRQHGWWLLLMLALLLYLPGTSTIPLMDRDEPRFAHATVEMVERGSWAIPYFNGEYRFDKPPLTYWWMRLHYALLGVNELAARLHSVLAAYGVALVVAGMARQLTRNAGAGLLAGVAWLTCLQALVHGRLCVADMPMILLVALACRSLVELLACAEEGPQPQRWNGWFWCLWLSLGAGFLAKGPIAWFVPALALVLWRWVLWKKPLPWRRLQAWPGLCLALAMVAAWGIPALIETQGAFWKTGMGEHVVKRGTDVFNGRKFVPGYYLLTTWLSLFPWMGFALPAWRSLRANWTAQTSFLAAWFLAPQLIFFFYATQLPHYVMPGYPAFIVLLALAWQKRNHTVPAVAKWQTLALSALLALGWVFVFAAQVPPGGIRGLLFTALLLLTSVLVVGGVVVCLLWKQGMTRRNSWLVCLTVALTTMSLALLGHQLRSTSIPVLVAAQLGPLPKGITLHGCGYTEPSLVFYTDHRWIFTDDVSSAQRLLQPSGPVAVVILKREWTLNRWFKGLLGIAAKGTAAKDHTAIIQALDAESNGMQSQKIEGFNVARFSWAEVQLIVRR